MYSTTQRLIRDSQESSSTASRRSPAVDSDNEIKIDTDMNLNEENLDPPNISELKAINRELFMARRLHQKLEGMVENSIVSIRNAAISNRNLERKLLRNYVYDTQLSQFNLTTMVSKLIEKMRLPPFIPVSSKNVSVVVMATDFDKSALKPRFASLAHLQTIIEDVMDVDQDDWEKVEEAKALTDEHMPWVNTRMRTPMMLWDTQDYRLLH